MVALVKTDQGSPLRRIFPKLRSSFLQMILQTGVRGTPDPLTPFVGGVRVDPLYGVASGFLKQPFINQAFKEGSMQLLEVVP